MAAFLAARTGFGRIAECVAEVLAGIPAEPAQALEQVMAVDRRARTAAASWLHRHPG